MKKWLTRRAGGRLGTILAVLLLAAGATPGDALNSAFVYLGALSNVITPNGDGLNDFAIFCYDNPKSSDVTGTIYDLRGRRVASLARDSNANCPGAPTVPTIEKLVWDARSGGRVVSSGIYIYQIQSEGTTVTGTVMVVR